MTANRSTLSDLDLSNMTLSSNHNNSIDSQLNINGQGPISGLSNMRICSTCNQLKQHKARGMCKTCYNTHNARERKKLNEGRPCQNCHKVKTLGCRNMCRTCYYNVVQSVPVEERPPVQQRSRSNPPDRSTPYSNGNNRRVSHPNNHQIPKGYRVCVNCHQMKKHNARGLCLNCYNQVYSIPKQKMQREAKRMEREQMENDQDHAIDDVAEDQNLNNTFDDQDQNEADVSNLSHEIQSTSGPSCLSCKQSKQLAGRGLCRECYTHLIAAPKAALKRKSLIGRERQLMMQRLESNLQTYSLPSRNAPQPSVQQPSMPFTKHELFVQVHSPNQVERPTTSTARQSLQTGNIRNYLKCKKYKKHCARGLCRECYDLSGYRKTPKKKSVNGRFGRPNVDHLNLSTQSENQRITHSTRSRGNLVTCLNCNQLKKHASKGLCRQCYDFNYNYVFRRRRSNNHPSRSQSQPNVRNVEAEQEENQVMDEDASIEDESPQQFTNSSGRIIQQCAYCTDIKPHFSHGLCRMCHYDLIEYPRAKLQKQKERTLNGEPNDSDEDQEDSMDEEETFLTQNQPIEDQEHEPINGQEDELIDVGQNMPVLTREPAIENQESDLGQELLVNEELVQNPSLTNQPSTQSSILQQYMPVMRSQGVQTIKYHNKGIQTDDLDDLENFPENQAVGVVRLYPPSQNQQVIEKRPYVRKSLSPQRPCSSKSLSPQRPCSSKSLSSQSDESQAQLIQTEKSKKRMNATQMTNQRINYVHLSSGEEDLLDE